MMLVDYASSGVGPYRELLFVPGRFRIAGRKYPVITRIVVSTQASVDSGRANWAIPKEIADFQIEESARDQRWKVTQNDDVLYEVSVVTRGPALPVTTRILPKSWATVAQPRDETFLLTHLQSRGWARLARLTIHDSVHGFPDLSKGRLMLAAAIGRFRMTFPVPAALKASCPRGGGGRPEDR